MKQKTYYIYLLMILFLLGGCIPKSQFDESHAPYYLLPWDFAITEILPGNSSAQIIWSNSRNTLRYDIIYKDVLDATYTTIDHVSSPYTLNGLNSGHNYLVKVRAFSASGEKTSVEKNIYFSTPPVVTDFSVPDFLAGSSSTINLPYTDPENDLATSCALSSLDGVSISSPCICLGGVCSVAVTGSGAFLGAAGFLYSVTAGGQTSNAANVTFNLLCPSGFVASTADALVNNFCVMQFEAKNIGSVATSVATSVPWNNITEANARAQCLALGNKYGLISNSEWMAIATGIELTASNWSSGVAGSGMINSGHNDSSFISNDILSVSDTTDSYNGTGNNSSQLPGSGWEQKRTHTILNGNIIWDFGGNLSEWIDWRITPINKAYHSSDGSALNTPIEFLSLDTNILSTQEMKRSSWQTSNLTLDSTYGIGKYIAGMNNSGGFARRSGSWSDQLNAGVFSLDLSSDASTAFSTTGFRCVYRP